MMTARLLRCWSQAALLMAAGAVAAAPVGDGPGEGARKPAKSANAGMAAKSAKSAKAPKAAKAAKAIPVSHPGDAPLLATPAVEAFIAAVAQRRGLPETQLRQQLLQARRLQAVRSLIMPPPAGTAKNWAVYRERFIEPRRIDAGLTFWDRHAAALEAAQAREGVPAAVVASIIGVETFYGRITGSFRVLDALATLAFDFPSGRKDRSAFFRDELEEFFVFCAREGREPADIKGSFAGAIGLPQFMPGSINRLAVDGDGDGHIDLLRSPGDAIASVAHFLAAHGWQRDMATHHAVAAPVDTAERALLLAADILPSFSAADFAFHGAVLDAAGQAHAGPLALIELQNGDRAPQYVAGTENFYVITRYNWSSYYAMAVIELAQALERARAAAR